MDPEVALFGLAMEREDADAATRHLTTLKALAGAEQLTWDNYLQIGEIYEEHDKLRQAHRWLTMPSPTPTLTTRASTTCSSSHVCGCARHSSSPVTGSTSARSRSAKCVGPSLIEGSSQKTSMRAP